jgi:hypothetical protein
MKYTTQSFEELDQQIGQMFDLSMPNSAFKRVIPANVRAELRRQYVEYLEESIQPQEFTEENIAPSRSVSTQVIKVNISSLRKAGFCCCPNELAAACESLIKQEVDSRSTVSESEKQSDMKNLTENVQEVGKNNSSKTVEHDMECDAETTNSKHDDCASDNASLAKVSEVKAKKAYPAKMGKDDDFEHKKSKTAQQSRSVKRKYFTKYMSNEFSKDTKPICMSDMDSKTQSLFREKDFNELVSEITGIN